MIDSDAKTWPLPGLCGGFALGPEGLEKVLTSMLEQSPPLTDDDISANNHHNLKDLHRLPNGVWLRLAMGAIVNNLSARQPFHLPYRQTHPPQTQSPGHASLQDAPIAPSDLPDVLWALALSQALSLFVSNNLLINLHLPWLCIALPIPTIQRSIRNHRQVDQVPRRLETAVHHFALSEVMWKLD
jgi:hypothetical protein